MRAISSRTEGRDRIFASQVLKSPPAPLCRGVGNAVGAALETVRYELLHEQPELVRQVFT